MVEKLSSSSKNFDKEAHDLGFSSVPILSFNQLLSALVSSSWWGRCVYVMDHLLGAFPYFNTLLALVRQWISASNQPKVISAGFEQKTIAAKMASKSLSEVEPLYGTPESQRKSKSLEASWSSTEEEDEELYRKNDIELERLFLEIQDKEKGDADKTKEIDSVVDGLSLAEEKLFTDDQTYSELLQAKLYSESP